MWVEHVTMVGGIAVTDFQWIEAGAAQLLLGLWR